MENITPGNVFGPPIFGNQSIIEQLVCACQAFLCQVAVPRVLPHRIDRSVSGWYELPCDISWASANPELFCPNLVTIPIARGVRSPKIPNVARAGLISLKLGMDPRVMIQADDNIAILDNEVGRCLRSIMQRIWLVGYCALGRIFGTCTQITLDTAPLRFRHLLAGSSLGEETKNASRVHGRHCSFGRKRDCKHNDEFIDIGANWESKVLYMGIYFEISTTTVSVCFDTSEPLQRSEFFWWFLRFEYSVSVPLQL